MSTAGKSPVKLVLNRNFWPIVVVFLLPEKLLFFLPSDSIIRSSSFSLTFMSAVTEYKAGLTICTFPLLNALFIFNHTITLPGWKVWWIMVYSDANVLLKRVNQESRHKGWCNLHPRPFSGVISLMFVAKETCRTLLFKAVSQVAHNGSPQVTLEKDEAITWLFLVIYHAV